MNWWLVADLLLLVVAACRVTRIFTTDTIGQWYVVEPAEAWADRHEQVLDLSDHEHPVHNDDEGWRHRLVSGLSCPWCVGLYVCITGVLSLVAVRGWWPDTAVEGWRLLAAPFVLNYVQAHINARLDN